MAIISNIRTKWKSIRNTLTSVVFNTAKDSKGKTFSENVGWNDIAANNSSNKYLVFALQIASGNPDCRLQLTAMTGLAGTNDDYLVEFWVNPTVGGAPLSYNTVYDSKAEIAIGAISNTITPATSRRIFCLYRHERTAESVEIPRAEEIQEGDILVMSVQGRTNGLDFYGGIIWDEYNINDL